MAGLFKWKSRKLERGNIKKAVSGRNSIAYIMLGLAMLAMTFFGVCTPNQGGGGLSGIAATVAGQEIGYQEFRRAYENTHQRYSRIYGGAFDPAAMGLAKSVLDGLVQQRLTYQQARDAGVVVSNDEVEKQILDIFKDDKGKFDAERFELVLRQNGFTEAGFADEIKRQMTVQKYRAFMGDVAYVASDLVEMDYQLSETKLNVDYLKLDLDNVNVSVTGDDITKFLDEAGKKKVSDYYTSHQDEFNNEKEVKARHILIAYKGARNAGKKVDSRTKEQAKVIADKVAKLAKAKPADFAKLAKQYTDEASGRNKGGDLGFFKKQDMVSEFSDVAFKMKKGEVSVAVESPFGFHIIKADVIKPAKTRTQEQASKSIATKLIEKDRKPEVLKRRSAEVLASLKNNSGSKKLLGDYGLKWQSTGSFAVDSRSIPSLGVDEGLMAAALGLQKKGQISGLISVGDVVYILKLKDKQQPNLKSLDQKKKKQLEQSAAYDVAGSFFGAINKDLEEKLKSKGKIWLNEDFIAIDQQRSPSNDG